MSEHPAILEARTLVEQRDAAAKAVAELKLEVGRLRDELRESRETASDLRHKYAQAIDVVKMAARLHMAHGDANAQNFQRCKSYLFNAVDAFAVRVGMSVNSVSRIAIVFDGDATKAVDVTDHNEIFNEPVRVARIGDKTINVCGCGALLADDAAMCGYCANVQAKLDARGIGDVAVGRIMRPSKPASGAVFSGKTGWEGDDPE